ncbi:hypothetical protein BH10ACI4_BH10ACI4_39140 [soil metagenome]
MSRLKAIVLAVGVLTGAAGAEVCTTQSQMKAADRDGLAAAAAAMAAKVQAGDGAGLRAVTVPELGKDFNGVQNVVASTAPKLKDAVLTVEQVYLLDGSELKRAADGSAPDAQFFCSLNKSMAEVDFLIPQLPPGRYGFAIVDSKNAAPWRLSFLLRQEGGQWALAGFYPRATLAAGHDGLWYWTEARQMVKRKEQWSAWLYFQQAEALLRPANFVQSTHLEKLQTERTAAAPPTLSEGVTAEAPLVVKGADGVEYRFTGLSVDDSLAKEKIDVVAHLKVDAIGDAAIAKKRNSDAMSALVGAYPELRKSFHGVWIFTDAAGQNPFVTESSMSEIK